MRILAIETVGTTGSVAALDGERVLAEQQLDATRRSAQTLTPALGQMLAEVGWSVGDVQLVAVATGPGSFTGLRIGVTTAKSLAYAWGCRIVGVDSLAAIAWQVPRDVAKFTAVLDAQRGELYAADFQRNEAGEPIAEEATRVVASQTWLEGLLKGSTVTGPGLASVAAPLPDGVVAVDRSLWAPTAGSVGQVAWRLSLSDPVQDPFSVLPQYYRQTAAEEQWNRKRG